MKVAYLGFGDFGKQIQGFLDSVPHVNESIYFDDKLAKVDNAHPFLDFKRDDFSDCSFYLGLGYQHLALRNSLIHELIKLGRKVPNFKHASALVSPFSKLAEGCFIYPGCNLDAGVYIMQGAVINNSVCISHNSTIGICSYLAPGVIVSGNVVIGENTFIGSGTIIANNVRIGDNCRIGIGSVVTASIPSSTQAIGNPLRILKHPLNLI